MSTDQGGKGLGRGVRMVSTHLSGLGGGSELGLSASLGGSSLLEESLRNGDLLSSQLLNKFDVLWPSRGVSTVDDGSDVTTPWQWAGRRKLSRLVSPPRPPSSMILCLPIRCHAHHRQMSRSHQTCPLLSRTEAHLGAGNPRQCQRRSTLDERRASG
mgnify:CR=1 FL=1|jgi:hypothetical protein